MAEAAGLVLGVIGVAASFKACIELFDFIVSVKESNEEYEQLSALVSGILCYFNYLLTNPFCSWDFNACDSKFGESQSGSHLADSTMNQLSLIIRS
jgi:hypothetical protein